MGKTICSRSGQIINKESALPLAQINPTYRRDSRKSLKLLLKVVLNSWNTNFHLKNSHRENKTTFPDVTPLLPEICHWNDPELSVFYSLTENFPKRFVNGKPPTLAIENAYTSNDTLSLPGSSQTSYFLISCTVAML